MATAESFPSDVQVVSYKYPRSIPSYNEVRVRINSIPVFAYANDLAAFVCAEWNGKVEVEIKANFPVEKAVIRPLSRGLEATITDTFVRFTLDKPQNVSVEIEGLKPIYVFGNEPEKDAPKPGDPGVHFFAAGQVYEIDEFLLKDNETFYIEGGAVVRGALRATNAKNVRVCGRGVFDGSYFRRAVDSRRSIVFEGCENVRLEDITMIEPSSWMVVLGASTNVEVNNIRQLGKVISSDGIDVVGSQNVTIRNCFLRNNDDCVVVKAVDFRNKLADATCDWRGDVDNVLVENCVFINDQGGNAMEIGFETRTESIRNIIFRDIDVLTVHGHGAVFSIHNGDRATISDVLWEDIRVEHHYAKLIDFRIVDSSYRRDEQFGQVRNIRLKNIRVNYQSYNVGYSISLIGGLNPQHTVENVYIEDLYFNDKKITNADALDLYCKNASGIHFE